MDASCMFVVGNNVDKNVQDVYGYTDGAAHETD